MVLPHPMPASGPCDLLVEPVELTPERAKLRVKVMLEALRVEPVQLTLDDRATRGPLLELGLACAATDPCRDPVLVVAADRLGFTEQRLGWVVGVAVLRAAMQQARRVAAAHSRPAVWSPDARLCSMSTTTWRILGDGLVRR